MPFIIQLSAIMRPVLQEQTAKPVKTVNTVRIAPKTEEAAVCANNSRPSKQKPSLGMVLKILLSHLETTYSCGLLLSGRFLHDVEIRPYILLIFNSLISPVFTSFRIMFSSLFKLLILVRNFSQKSIAS